MALILAVLAGVVAGVLVNYFADVLPVTRRLSRPACAWCGQDYAFSDYLFARQCAHCSAPRPLRPIFVVIATVTACILLYLFPIFTLSFWAALPVLLFMGVLLVIDIEHRLVLIETSLFGLVLFAGYGAAIVGWRRMLLGGLGGFLIMFLLYLSGVIFSKIVGFIRRKRISEVAFGFGDVCAGTVFGLLLGWPSILVAILIGMMAFGVFSFILITVLIFTKKYRSFTNAQPFVPYLILGVIATFYL